PAAPWNIESGQGMGATLGIANDRQAYTLSDRATLLAFSRRVDLKPMVEGDRLLLNIYSVMEVNPANGPRVNTAGGKAFAEFMLVVSAVNTGMGLPPVVVGLFVTILLWRSGPLGALEILYTPTAIVMAQAVIAAPIVTGITLAAVQNVPAKFRLQLVALGAS